jgi:phage shock protein E
MKSWISLMIALLLLSLSCRKERTSSSQPIPEQTVWVDVRTPAEYARGHVPGAFNLPHDDIRANHPLLTDGTLPKDHTLTVYCRSGRRSNIADHRLTQLGYKVIDLESYGNAMDRYRAQQP